ncbi:MAG: hypothetical protein C5B53_02985, partial [Candidatus Melainabacteria bacterium]
GWLLPLRLAKLAGVPGWLLPLRLAEFAGVAGWLLPLSGVIGGLLPLRLAELSRSVRWLLPLRLAELTAWWLLPLRLAKLPGALIQERPWRTMRPVSCLALGAGRLPDQGNYKRQKNVKFSDVRVFPQATNILLGQGLHRTYSL